MIIDYDRNPALTTDQKIQSLVENIQRAMNELVDDIQKNSRDIEKLQERTEE